MAIILDAIIMFIVASTVFLTYKKGFVKSILDFISVIVAIILTNILSPIVSNLFIPTLIKHRNNSENLANVTNEVLELLARAMAFIALFAIISITLKFLSVFVAGIFKLSVLNKLDKILGLILGCVKSFVFIFLLIGIAKLCIPFVIDSQSGFLSEETIQNTLIFKHLYKIKWINFFS